jgi:hypothetical protein
VTVIGLLGTAQAVLGYTPPIRPLYWSGPESIDPGHALIGMSCPSTALCVATDDRGDVLASTEPTNPDSWTPTPIAYYYSNLHDISCASTSLCVAIGEGQTAYVSSDPAGAPAVWTPVEIDAAGTKPLTGVSCVQGPLCVAVDGTGNIIATTNPTAGISAWKASSVDAGNELRAVSCVSVALCVAVDNAGNVLAATSPASGAGAWRKTDVNGTGPIDGVSCTAAPLCVASAGPSQNNAPTAVLTSTDPANGSWTWTSTFIEPGMSPLIGGTISCVEASLCVALEDGSNDGMWETINPAAGPETWVNDDPDITILRSLSCTTRSFCVIGDIEGNIITSVETHELSVSFRGSGTGNVSATPMTCSFYNCTHPVPAGMLLIPTPTALFCSDEPLQGTVPCALGYPTGTSTTLTANPAAGSVFAGWSGPCTGNANTCALTMNANQPVVADFSPISQVSPSEIPTISNVRQTTSRWREGNAKAQITSRQHASHQPPLGTAFSFQLNVPASVTLNFQTSAPGRQSGHLCLAPDAHPPRHRCTRVLPAGTLHINAHQGTNTIRFQGRISPHVKLKTGHHTLQLTATGEHSAPPALHFTITSS